MKKIIVFSLLLLFHSAVYAADFTKTSYEEFYRYHQFKRADGNGWLEVAETISTCEIKCYEKITGTETTSTMISDTGVDANTRCKYKVKAGTVGKTYTIKIKIVTSTGQKFQDSLEFSVL